MYVAMSHVALPVFDLWFLNQKLGDELANIYQIFFLYLKVLHLIVQMAKFGAEPASSGNRCQLPACITYGIYYIYGITH